MEKILVAMSGGVDSSATASLLMEEGYEVEGVTFSFFDPEEYSADGKVEKSPEEEAKVLCDKLGIKHHVMHLEMEFKDNIVDYFVASYMEGQTPNPCVKCNREMKFEYLIKKADELGIEKIATGHYADVVFDEKSQRYAIKMARNLVKDQSYFLYRLTQDILKRLILPLGDYENKDEVRKYMSGKDEEVALKTESQDVCFIKEKNYIDFLKKHGGIKDIKGDFIDVNGEKIGEHKGYFRYTVGQRRGFGMGFGKRVYVTSTNPASGEVTLGNEEDLYKKTVMGKNANFMALKNGVMEQKCKAKVRYSQLSQEGKLQILEDNNIIFEFNTKQKSVAKGQSIVFYEGEVIIGGAEII